MSTSIEKRRLIDQLKLEEDSYFQSLVEQALEKGLIQDCDIQRLQNECLELLARKTELYNSGDSSIQVEKAQSIMSSNLFTIGLWLKTYPHADDAVKVLSDVSIHELYKKGREQIDLMVKEAKIAHHNLINNLFDTNNTFYRSTLDDGIHGFFKLYYPDFQAHEIHITADYPAYIPPVPTQGIEFIKTYIEVLTYENQFCCYFDAENIHYLLKGYEEDYQGLLVNLYGLVLLTAIGCVLAGTEVIGLNITQEGIERLEKRLSDLSDDALMEMVGQAVMDLAVQFKCDKGLTQYMQNSVQQIIRDIQLAKDGDSLSSLFFLPVYPMDIPNITVSFGAKMDDEQYRMKIEELKECHHFKEKLSIIKEDIFTLADLEEVLLDAYLETEEIEAVLRELSLPESAAFAKKYLIFNSTDPIYWREREQVLRSCLYNIINKLPKEQQDMMEKLARVINIE